MTLWEALGLPPLARAAMIGGGGKTSLLFQLGQSRPESILTTTTKMYVPRQSWVHPQTRLEFVPGKVTYLYNHLSNEGKAVGLQPAAVDALASAEPERPLLFEADGSRGRPVKIHGDHEPVIPSCTREVVVVFGLHALFRPLGEETVHRSQLLGEWEGKILSVEIAEALIRRMLARVPVGLSVAVLLNQAAPSLREAGRELASRLGLRVVLREHDWWEG